ncbi:DUF5996 family protein [Rhodococcoides fascians]|uniref:DUF5996 family protein n=1 Tax=Rhodococcoides fascians TaxID=1828 RepID=UPI0005634600|nr:MULTISPECIES: DUF5996 family protein [Rhodococcus]OZF04841.1 hypothetical protein CH301_04735 [Rhodococcus sp. 15-1189-1-1a]OZF19104.1 hypothetical protein CH299_05280 [Rhodococcus sp. 14-2686-1-2]
MQPEYDAWPSLPVDSWIETRDTVQLWTQIVGKTRMALGPAVNHWWGVPLYVDARGLTTSLMPVGDRGLEIRFDFLAHELIFEVTDGSSRRMKLEPRTVADFYSEYTAHLDALKIDVDIVGTPVELPDATPFAEDTVHGSYDAEAVSAFWRSLVSAHSVFSAFRADFRGKSSPVHFFWGAFDLAVTRFSGRPAPTHPGGIPNCPDWVMHEAYSDEVSSAGYWPGGAEEGVFYAYAYPHPDGYDTHPAVEAPGRWDSTLGEYVLPYHLVRQSDDPAATVRRFLEQTHRAAVETAGW